MEHCEFPFWIDLTAYGCGAAALELASLTEEKSTFSQEQSSVPEM